MGKGGGSIPQAVAIEPIKPAAQTMREAAEDTARAQRLRRGLASTFSRSGMWAPSAPTSGSSQKLGR